MKKKDDSAIGPKINDECNSNFLLKIRNSSPEMQFIRINSISHKKIIKK